MFPPREYRLHRNEIDDVGYRKYLSRLSEPLLARLPHGLLGLDYGCGPGPALVGMLKDAGHHMTAYDPLFFDDPAALDATYDFITCSEVAEHFHRPAEEFERLDGLLKPGGLLAVMTTFQTDDHRFAHWHYRRDLTHVAFYRESTVGHDLTMSVHSGVYRNGGRVDRLWELVCVCLIGLVTIGCGGGGYPTRGYHQRMALADPSLEADLASLDRKTQAELDAMLLASVASKKMFGPPGGSRQNEPLTSPDVAENRYICNPDVIIRLLRAGADLDARVQIGHDDREGAEELEPRPFVREHYYDSPGRGLWANCSAKTIEAVYRSPAMAGWVKRTFDQREAAERKADDKVMNQNSFDSGQATLAAISQKKKIRAKREAAKKTPKQPPKFAPLQGTAYFGDRIERDGERTTAFGEMPPIPEQDAYPLLAMYVQSVHDSDAISEVLARFLYATTPSPTRNAAVEEAFEAWVSRGAKLPKDSNLGWRVVDSGTLKMFELLRTSAFECSNRGAPLFCKDKPGWDEYQTAATSQGFTMRDIARHAHNEPMRLHLTKLGVRRSSQDDRDSHRDYLEAQERSRDRWNDFVARQRAEERRQVAAHQERRAAEKAEATRRAWAGSEQKAKELFDPKNDVPNQPLYEPLDLAKAGTSAGSTKANTSASTKADTGSSSSAARSPDATPAGATKPAKAEAKKKPEWRTAGNATAHAAPAPREGEKCIRYEFVEPISFTVCMRKSGANCYFDYENHDSNALKLRWSFVLSTGGTTKETTRLRLDAGASGHSAIAPSYCQSGVRGVRLRYQVLE